MSGAPDILQRIVAGRRERLARERDALPLAELRARVAGLPPALSLAAALGRPGLAVIAELKRASPSAGVIREDFDVERLAGELAAGGAAALSVLTEEDHFQGHPVNLAHARRGAPGVPLLRKDFLVEPWQLWESRSLGADAVLLIAALLPGSELPAMLAAAAAAGLECLVEIHQGEELDRVLAAGAGMIGVNARDLRSFAVDLRPVEDLAALLPSGVLGVAESGVRDAADLRRLQAAGYAGVLVGTALMRRRRPGAALRGWLDQACPENGA